MTHEGRVGKERGHPPGPSPQPYPCKREEGVTRSSDPSILDAEVADLAKAGLPEK